MNDEETLKQQLRRNAIIDILGKGRRNWTQLRKLKRFRSKRDLSKTLKQLEAEGLIKRIELSRKNVQYILTEDFELLRKLQNEDVKAEEALREILNIIETSKTDLGLQKAIPWVSSILLLELSMFLYAVEHVVRCPEKFRSYARGWLLERFVDRFGKKLASFGRTFETHMDDAMRGTFLLLLRQILLMSRASGTLPPKDAEPTWVKEYNLTQEYKKFIERLSRRARAKCTCGSRCSNSLN